MIGALLAEAKVWPVMPTWKGGVRESLSWATDIGQSSATAATHHRSYRLGPRREFSFDVLAGGQESRVADMLLAGHRGEWLLPIWPDVQPVASPVEIGDEFIPCRTAGFDFAAGGLALLYAGLHRWEVVSVSAIASDHLSLGLPVTAEFLSGTRLLPLRRAWVRDGSEALMLSDRISRRTLEVDIAEPCDWPVLSDGVEYLGTRVLDVRPDASDDPSHSYAGLRKSVDFGVAVPVVADLPGITLREQRDSWKLFGRSEHSWFRSLLYTLRGRQRRIWVPSWCDDLRPVLPVAGGSSSIAVEWAGYTQFALGRQNRRDIRIQLLDGTVYYRRIVDALDTGSIEILTLDAALDGAGISVHQIRQVSFLSMAALASDVTEINHITDAEGTARATTGWQAVVPDV